MKRPFQFKLRWDGADHLMVPANTPTMNYCDQEFADGEVITLERSEERSVNSHNHFFVALTEAWSQLPETLMDEYPTVDALRAKALIKTGYYHERTMVCSSVDEARKIAAFVQPLNHFAIIDVRDNVIRIYTAKSQSRTVMKKKEFQDSKDAVLQFVANLVGVSPEDLAKNAGRSA